MCLDELAVTVFRLVGAVHVGAIQGAVTHAEYRIRSVRPAEQHRRLADDDQHADRCHLLRAVRRSFHHAHPVFRRLQTPLQRQGRRVHLKWLNRIWHCLLMR